MPTDTLNTAIRAKNLPAEARRNVTVETVIDLAGTMNPGDITTAAIAKHMQLTQGALFRHFANKEAIWHEVMQWVATHLMARIDASAAGPKEPLVALQAMFQAHVAFVAEHPGAPRMLFGELQGAKMTPAKQLAQTMMAQYAARLNDLFRAAMARGDLPPNLDVAAATVLFIGTIQGLVMQALISGDMAQMLDVAPRVFVIYRQGIEKGAPVKRGS